MTKKKRNEIPPQPELLSLNTLKALICKGDTGLLFCFGSSFISRVIQAKTKEYDEELVPSHVAMIVDGQFLYESTSAPERLGNKRIPAGVRRYLLKDFLRLERTKNTEYYFYDTVAKNNNKSPTIHSHNKLNPNIIFISFITIPFQLSLVTVVLYSFSYLYF